MLLFLASVGCAQAQDGQLTENMLPENMDIHVALELGPDGSFHLTAAVDGRISGEIAQLPVSSAQVHVEITSPGLGEVKAAFEGTVTISGGVLVGLDQQTRAMLDTLTAEMIDNFVVSMQIEGKPLSDILSGLSGLGEGGTETPEMENIIIENINCTEFSWTEPTVEFALDVILSGGVFENEEMLSYLPATIDLSLKSEVGLLSLSVDAVSKNGEVRITLDVANAENGLDLSASIEARGKIPGFKEGEPYTFQIPSEAQEALAKSGLGGLLERNNVSFELRVPEDWEATGLPGSPSRSGGTYSWTGSSAAEALGLLLSGQSTPQVNLSPTATPAGTPTTTPTGGAPGGGGEGQVWVWVGVGIAVVAVFIFVAAVVLRRR